MIVDRVNYLAIFWRVVSIPALLLVVFFTVRLCMDIAADIRNNKRNPDERELD